MKKIFLMACFVMAMGIICSCSKDDEPSPDNPYAETVYSKVNLTITVTENSTVTSGATVRLYNDLTNYEKGTKNIGTLTTDSKGQATFLVESEKTYYFSVEKDGKTNALNKNSIYCSNKSENVSAFTKIAEIVGTIILKNEAEVPNAGQYKFIVKNTTTGYSEVKYVSYGNSLTLNDMPLGSYSVYMEQQDGYVFIATNGTMTGALTLQNNYTLIFNTANL